MFKITDKTSCVIPNLHCDKVVTMLYAKYLSLNIKELSCPMHVFYMQYTDNSLYICEDKVCGINIGQWFGHISVQNISKVTLLITFGEKQ